VSYRDRANAQRVALLPILELARELADRLGSDAAESASARDLALLVRAIVRPCADCDTLTLSACPCCGAPFCAAPECPGQKIDCCLAVSSSAASSN
jgi:hypothetical protein